MVSRTVFAFLVFGCLCCCVAFLLWSCYNSAYCFALFRFVFCVRLTLSLLSLFSVSLSCCVLSFLAMCARCIALFVPSVPSVSLLFVLRRSQTGQGVARHTKEGYAFQHTAMTKGFKEAVAQRYDNNKTRKKSRRNKKKRNKSKCKKRNQQNTKKSDRESKIRAVHS